MKKRLLATLLTVVMVCALGVTTQAVEYTVTEIVPFGKYDNVGDYFSEGLASVYLNGKFGFIDKTGREVIPCKYDDAWIFSEGLAAVKLDGKYGYIDKTGKEIVPCKYDHAYRFSEGLAVVTLNGKYGFVDKTGKEVVPCKYDYAYDFSEGLALVHVGKYPNTKYGFIDKTGKMVISLKSNYSAESFSEGLAKVCDGTNHKNKRGFIDKTGRQVIPCKYDNAGDFSEGLAVVTLNGKYGFVDKTGKEVVPCRYEAAANFSEGLARVQRDGKQGFVDKTGNEVIPCQYYAAKDFSEGLAPIEPEVGKQGFIDKTGREVIPVGKYYRVNSFSEGFAAVAVRDSRNNEYYGFIDKTGKVVVPCQYNRVWPFSDGAAKVRNNNNGRGFISLTLAMAHPSTQTVDVDGEKIEFQCYALKDEAGNDTNYIKLRDLADILNGSAAQFEVGWDGNITITTKTAYTQNGTEQNTPFSGERTYEKTAVKTLVDGVETELDTFQLKDDNGGGYTYYKLRDLGKALGITVDWSAERGIYIETK